MRRHLKPLRVTIALLVLGAFTAGFADFRGVAPVRQLAHWLAELQFMPALIACTAGGSLAVVLAVLLLGTLLFGRVYCSTLCPLGLMQDAVARIADWLTPRCHALPFKRGNRWLRYGTLAVVAVMITGGAGSFAFTHGDPYSNFGRIVSGLFRPLLAAANNLLVAPANLLGMQQIYRVEPPWPGLAILVPAVIELALVAGLAAWRRRIYCNTLCPVGIVLGVLARWSAFRLTIDREACTKCAACLRGCKAQCLDLRRGVIDASRCVMCLNCLDACREPGLGIEFAWKRPERSAAPAPLPTVQTADPQRRAFVAGMATLALTPAAAIRAAVATAPAAAPRAPVTPPGSGGTARFLERCTACQLCVSACLTQVLRPAALEYGFAGFMKPRLDFEKAYCNYDCHRCGEVCPTGAIALLGVAEKQITSVGTARFEQSRCIVETDGTDCAACSEHCPTKAVDTVPFRGNLRLPKVNEELCIGCGACEYACPVRPQKAIVVSARAEHIRARKSPETKPAEKRPTADFPF
jgi:ferredoxin